MRKILLICVFIVCIIYARENPFLPIDEANSSLVTTNVNLNAKPFDRKIFNLPNDAREIDRVVIYYKSVDGSIKEKTVDINSSINWKDGLSLSVVKAPEPSTTPVLDISVTKSSNSGKKMDEQITSDSIKTEILNERNISNSIIPNIVVPLKTITFKNLIRLDVHTKSIKFVTNDTLINDFKVDGQNKIAIDFSRKKASFKTKVLDISCGIFKNATFGAHGKFYRVVISLDKNYKYELLKDGDNYILKAK
ncbi:MAG: AMIN domain-containing protein [Campylobacter sputorum]|uniref:AMIN domain-containing protein n=1 Tax=Campylobacter sputorum TaxID=206 RepID=UPI000B793B15|nr:AMIN domain-containing protein [Campylobacter sputorum]ASM37852.1 hypothetical protein CSPARA_0242 [Campylobacter sputorum bv. paraureolyticus LMG 11764]MDY6119847.1 AMIN domain-containing protein [Campylobacter sputorum]